MRPSGAHGCDRKGLIRGITAGGCPRAIVMNDQNRVPSPACDYGALIRTVKGARTEGISGQKGDCRNCKLAFDKLKNMLHLIPRFPNMNVLPRSLHVSAENCAKRCSCGVAAKRLGVTVHEQYDRYAIVPSPPIM